ncbi:hypothetical protein TUBRATIS_11990 [Tubulinosema ratisbonensis]|uniref:Uncharacterized protein n=1 Tax=Tubulinosema ratisbonensis TaxID=291195 RepID=A0A437AM73_9MICR|nr:hypothetical protein TUBRATIS_11990 [Tubulinosema ratisbonensis]
MDRKLKELEEPLTVIVNKTTPRFSLPILKSTLESYSTLKKEAEKELYKNFLANKEDIITLITTYNEIAKMTSQYNKLFHKFNKSLRKFDFESEFIDSKKKEDFKILMSKFENVEYFVSQGRYLVHFDLFENNLLVLTNDLFFIGEKIKGDKYRLIKVFNYNVIQAVSLEDVLEIKTEKESFRFKKDKDSVLKIVSLVEEFNFQPQEFDQITEIKEMPSLEFYTKEDFIKNKHLDLSQTASFLVNKFIIGMKKINKISLTEKFLSDVFEYFWKFYDEQEELINDLQTLRAYILEEEIKFIFKYVEKRVFFVFNTQKTQNYLKLIKQKIKRNEVDFSYFMISLGFNDKEFKLNYENAKERIDDLLIDMKNTFVNK